MSLQEGLVAQNRLVYMFVIIAVLHRCLTWSRSLESCSLGLFQKSRDMSPGEYAVVIFLFPASNLCNFSIATCIIFIILSNAHSYLSAMGKGSWTCFSESEFVIGKIKYGDIPSRKLSFIEMPCYTLVTEYTLQLHTTTDWCKEE